MKLWIGITDGEWYRHLAALHPDEVNFWRPSGEPPFKSLPPGTPFLFQLKSPNRVIAGGGFFVSFTQLPVSLAWDAFQECNGAASRVELLKRIGQYRADGPRNADPVIGCTILAEPFFLDRDEWIPIPEDMSKNIVVGKSYDVETGAGAKLWKAVQDALLRRRGREPLPIPGPRDGDRRSDYTYLAHARLGQGAFRVLVTDAYERRCAVTGERTLPVLQAAHIKPYADAGPNHINNGLLLRSDLHILFDRGYLTVTPEHRLEVSARIREEYENGRIYYAMAGKRLVKLPEKEAELPGRDFLEWHNERVYLG